MPDRPVPTRPSSPAGRPDSSGAIDRPLMDRDRRIRALEARLAERDRLEAALRGRIVERSLYATWLESEVAGRESRLGDLARALDGRSAELERVSAELAAMKASRAWRVATRLGREVGRARSLAGRLRGLPARLNGAALARRSPLTPTGQERGPGAGTGRDDRPGTLPGQRPSDRAGVGDDRDAPASHPEAVPAEATSPPGGQGAECRGRDRDAILRYIGPRQDPYDVWLDNNAWDAARAAQAERDLAAMVRRPVISVVVAVGDATPSELRETLASIREQVYPDREVILVGGSEAVAGSLAGRAWVANGDQGGLGPFEALRSAAEEASGEYLVLLDGRTRLAPDALLEIAGAAVGGDEPPSLVFGDEDRVDPSGRRFGPRFRPGWSPELLLATPTIGRTFAVRRSAYEEVGGLRPEFEEAWSYDLALRLAERSGPVVHIPRVLAHVPADRGGPDPVDVAPPRAIAQAARALGEAMARRGIAGRVAQPDWAARGRVPAFELDFPDDGPRVAILIPTRDRVHLLRRCIASIVDRTTYRNYEIVVIDDGSDEPETLEYLEGLGGPCRVVRVDREGGPFNYARMHNRAIGMLDAGVEFVVLLNNDTEVRRGEWLGQLVGFGRMPGVGAVGARLLYGDGRVQHAGILSALHDGIPGHASRFSSWWDGGPQDQARLARNVAAVTAACLLTRRETFLGIGGFDERRFAVGYNDVDYCLRLGERGLRCVYAPRAELFHFEGASRGFEDSLEESAAFREAWGRQADPYHHPALARRDERSGLDTRRSGRIGADEGRPIRVLFDVGRLDDSGTARFVRHLVSGLVGQARVIPEILGRVDGPGGDLLRGAGIPVSILPAEDGDGPVARAHALGDRFAQGGYDLIHAVGLDGVTAIEAARLAGVPVLWTVREAVDFRDAFLPLDDEAARAAIEAFSRAYRVVFPSWGVRRPYHPVDSRRNFEVVYEHLPPADGIPGRAEARLGLGLAESTAVLSCIADREGDGIGDFLGAVSRLIATGRDVAAFLAVPEASHRGLSRAEEVRSLGDRIRLVRATDDLRPVLAASDLLVGCSRRELDPALVGLGLAFNLPMILGDVAGADEYACPGRTALMARPGDGAMLGDRIARLLDDPGERARFREAGRADRGRLGTFEGMVGAYARLYREAIAVGNSAMKAGQPQRRDAA